MAKLTAEKAAAVAEGKEEMKGEEEELPAPRMIAAE